MIKRLSAREVVQLPLKPFEDLPLNSYFFRPLDFEQTPPDQTLPLLCKEKFYISCDNVLGGRVEESSWDVFRGMVVYVYLFGRQNIIDTCVDA
jgi:hypothetical protein